MASWGRLVSLNPRVADVLLHADTILVGRSTENDVVHSDQRISSRHCRIMRQQGHTVRVEDLSSNGTFLNGKLIGKDSSVLFNPGDELSLVVPSAASVEESMRGSFVSYVLAVPSVPSTTKTIRREDTVTNPGVIEDFYDVQRDLGRGTFGMVKLAVHHATGEYVAVKAIDKERFFLLSPTQAERLDAEVATLKRVQHPNIIGLREVFNTPRCLYIVMEYVSGGELLDRIVQREAFGEVDARRIARQLLSAVQYLHGMGIVHRDLKPENILLADPSPGAPAKIADFGLAKILGEGEVLCRTFAGTPLYFAPEVLAMQSPLSPGYGIPCDMWSLGVILFAILSGTPPFSADNAATLFQRIQAAEYSFDASVWSTISSEAKDLVSGLLCVDPQRRLTACEALNHPWFLFKDPETHDGGPAIPSVCHAMKGARDTGQFTPAAPLPQLLRRVSACRMSVSKSIDHAEGPEGGGGGAASVVMIDPSQISASMTDNVPQQLVPSVSMLPCPCSADVEDVCHPDQEDQATKRHRA